MSNVPTQITKYDIAKTLLAQNAGEQVILIVERSDWIVGIMDHAQEDLSCMEISSTRPRPWTIKLRNGTTARAFPTSCSHFDSETGLMRTLSNRPTYWIEY